MHLQTLKVGSMDRVGAGMMNGRVPQVGAHWIILLACTLAGAAVTAANIIANLSRLDFKLDGITKQTFADPEFAMLLYQYYTNGAAITAGHVPIMLTDMSQVNRAERSLLAYGMGDSGPFTFSMVGSAGLAALCDTIDIITKTQGNKVNAKGEIIPYKLGVHRTLYEKSVTFGVAGTDLLADAIQPDITDLPDLQGTGGGRNLVHKAYHIEIPANCAIRWVEFECNYGGGSVMQIGPRITPAMLQDEQRANFKSPMTTPVVGGHSTFLTIDFDVASSLDGGMPGGAKESKLRICWAGVAGGALDQPGTYKIYIEKMERKV